MDGGSIWKVGKDVGWIELRDEVVKRIIESGV